MSCKPAKWPSGVTQKCPVRYIGCCRAGAFDFRPIGEASGLLKAVIAAVKVGVTEPAFITVE